MRQPHGGGLAAEAKSGNLESAFSRRHEFS